MKVTGKNTVRREIFKEENVKKHRKVKCYK